MTTDQTTTTTELHPHWCDLTAGCLGISTPEGTPWHEGRAFQMFTHGQCYRVRVTLSSSGETDGEEDTDIKLALHNTELVEDASAYMSAADALELARQLQQAVKAGRRPAVWMTAADLTEPVTSARHGAPKPAATGRATVSTTPT